MLRHVRFFPKYGKCIYALCLLTFVKLFFCVFQVNLKLKFSLEITKCCHSYFEGNYIFKKIFLNNREQNTYIFWNIGLKRASWKYASKSNGNILPYAPDKNTTK